MIPLDGSDYYNHKKSSFDPIYKPSVHLLPLKYDVRVGVSKYPYIYS